MARTKARGLKNSKKQAERLREYTQTVNKRGWKSNTDLRVVKKNKTTKCDWFGLHLVARRHGKQAVCGQETALNWREMMELANGKVQSCTATAAAKHISRRTVRRVLELVSYAEFEWQGSRGR